MTKTIAERAAGALALLAVALSAAAAPVPPEPPRGRALEYEAAERLFARKGPLEPFGEALERWQFDGRHPYQSLMLGSYARVERHLKLGAFYRLERGARHDDDWIRDAATKQWRWADTTSRPESSLVLDATPRAALPWLPGRTWTGSVKLRYEHDFFNGESVLRAAPELAWFWLDGLSPRATVFLRHEEAFPIGFGETTVWQRWTYLAALWHATPHLSLGPSVALRDEAWSTSTDYRSFKGESASYRVLYRAWVLGFTLVGRL